MGELTTRERFIRLMNFEPCDRTLSWEFCYWAGALKRWYTEGLPKTEGIPDKFHHSDIIHGPGLYWPASQGGKGGAFAESPQGRDVNEFFHMDEGIERVPINTWLEPEFEVKVLSEDERNKVIVNQWGVTQKVTKMVTSPPDDIDWPIKNRKDWEDYKERGFHLNIAGRLPKNWLELVELYKKRTVPLMIGGHPCGFYGSFRILCGDVGISMLYYDDPKLIHDILDYLTELWINLFEEVLKSVTPDWCLIWEDMAYNSGSMISPKIFREFMLPRYKKFIGFLKAHGVNVFHVDCDGDTTELIPLWMEGGVTGQYPLEPTGKMDMRKLRHDFPKFQLLGGINKKMLAMSKKEIDQALSFVPELIKQGGYIPYADHCIVEDTSWENMQYYRKQLWKIIENTPVLGGIR